MSSTVVLEERERLFVLMALVHMVIASPHLAGELRAIADKFGGFRGWEIVEKTIELEEMSNEGCVRQ